MKMLRALLVLSGLTPFFSGNTFSEEKSIPPSKEQIEKAVRSLGSPEIANREKAYRDLLERGVADPETVLPFLQPEKEDLEAQSACDRLRRAIPMEAAKRSALREAGEDAELRAWTLSLFEGDASLAISRFSQECVDVDAINAKRMPGHFKRPKTPRRFTWNRARAGKILMAWILASDGDERRSGSSTIMNLDEPSLAPLFLELLQARGCEEHASTWIFENRTMELAPRIAELLKHSEGRVRRISVVTLWRLECRDAILQRLDPLIQDKDPTVRSFIVEILNPTAVNGVQPKPLLDKAAAVPLLIDRLLADDSTKVRRAAIGSLLNYRDRSVVPHLAKLLPADDEYIRRKAAEAIGVLVRQDFDAKYGEAAVAAAKGWWERHKSDPEFQPKK